MGTTQGMTFRQWLHEIWIQNCDEHREYGETPLTQEQYFKTYSIGSRENINIRGISNGRVFKNSRRTNTSIC